MWAFERYTHLLHAPGLAVDLKFFQMLQAQRERITLSMSQCSAWHPLSEHDRIRKVSHRTIGISQHFHGDVDSDLDCVRLRLKSTLVGKIVELWIRTREVSAHEEPERWEWRSLTENAHRKNEVHVSRCLRSASGKLIPAYESKR